MHRDGAVLMQRRAAFLQEGGTWAAPGGALDVGESAVSGALREAEEEAAVPPEAVRLRHAWTVDHGSWSYTTVVADAAASFEARDVDGEGLAVRWVPVEAVTDLPLHSGFAAAWPQVRDLLGRREIVLVAGDATRSRDLLDLRDTGETTGLPMPSPLVPDVPGRSRAWPWWENAADPARRAADLTSQGWCVTVVSDDPELTSHLRGRDISVVETAAVVGGRPRT